MKTFFSFVIITLLTGWALAAEQQSVATVTLDELVAEALTRNPELEFYAAEIRAAQGERVTAGAWPNPTLGSDLGYKHIGGNGSATGAAWSASATQVFEYPGRVTLRKAIANRQIDLAELGLEQFRAALAAKVRSLGFALLIASEKATAAQEVSERGRELIDVLRQRDPAGVSALLETRIIEASVITLRREAAVAAREAQTALFDLNKLRGRPVATPLAIAKTSLEFPTLAPVEDLIAQALASNVELRTRDVELTQSGLKAQLSRNERWPSVQLGPQFSQETAGETEDRFGLGVSLGLPLWNRNAGNIATAEARRHQAETLLSVAQRNVEAELRSRYAAYESQRKEIAQWTPETIQRLREAAELGDRHYRLGGVPLATYVESQEKYLQALGSILATQAEALENRQQIDLLTGQAINKARRNNQRKTGAAAESAATTAKPIRRNQK